MSLLLVIALSHTTSAAYSRRHDQRQATDSLHVLKPGVPKTVETAGGETQVWSIHLETGDYLRLMITSKHGKLAVKLFDPEPDGLSKRFPNSPAEERPLITAVNQREMISGGENQVVDFLFVARVSGNYRLETSLLDRIGARLNYEVRIETLRPVTANDRIRIDAIRAELEGDVPHKEGTTEEKRFKITKYEIALAYWRELGDRRNEARMLNQIAVVYWRLGDLRSAYLYQNQGVQIAQEVGDLYLAGNSTLLIGYIQQDWGMFQQALDSFNRARRIFMDLSDRFGETIALQSTGEVYLDLGEYRLAILNLEQALSIYSSAGNTLRQSDVLNLLGRARRGLGENQQALEYVGRALEITREHGYVRQLGVALGELGDIYLMMGDREKSADYYSQLLTLSRKAGDERSTGDALHALGKLSSLASEPEKALAYLGQALTIYRRIGMRKEEAQTLHDLARTSYLLGNMDEARRWIEAALEIRESLRINVSRQDLRASVFSSAQNDFDFYIDLLMSLHRQQPSAGYDALALSASERSRARSLLEQLAEMHLDLEHGIDPDLAESARALQRQLNSKAAARAKAEGKSPSDSAAGLDREIEELTSHYRDIEAQIRRANPHYAALARPEPLTAAEIQRKLLDDGTVLLEFALGEEHSWLWAVTPQSIISRELPPRSEIEATARAVYLLLTARQQSSGFPQDGQPDWIAEADAKYKTAAQDLSDMLFGSIADSLSGEWKDKRLLIVADGALLYLPFGAFPLPVRSGEIALPSAASTPLIVEHEIVNLPSASVLDVIRRETGNRAPALKTVAVLADPVFDADDPRLHGVIKQKRKIAQSAGIPLASSACSAASPLERARKSLNRGSFGRLPFSTDEANAIASFVPAKSLLLATSFQASRARAMSGELADYRIIHFASHGMLNSVYPELSGLVLSLLDRNGMSRDGFLRMNDIYNMRLSANTVVLSACQTALGKEIKGEGLVGLTRGFMYAGAQRVVASLWQVDDSATAELMACFYRSMLKEGRRPAAALREAQMEMMKQKRWSSPYFWAGFVIQGEWN